MEERFFIAAKGLLGLRTNLKTFRWSFGTCMPRVTRSEYEACRVRLAVKIGPMQIPSKKWAPGKYHYFSGVPGDDVIYYNRPLMLNANLKIKVKGLLSDEPCVSANETYYHFVNYRFMNLHSIEYILTDLGALLLLRRGYAPLHCSAFKKGDRTVVVFAPPNTGKTLCTMMACMERGVEYLAEDLAIADGDLVYSVPWTSTFRYYSGLKNRCLSRTLSALRRMFPPIELMPINKPKSVSTYLDRAKICTHGKITHLVILERGNASVLQESPEEAYRKILNLNRYEFNYYKAPLLIAYEFFNPALSINEACKAESDILNEMVQRIRNRLVVRAPDPKEYSSLILNAIK
jgi:hypothetical protein